MKISFQLYSARNFSLEDCFRALAENGVRYVEGFDPLYEDPQATKALMDKYDLTMPTGHMGVESLDTQILGSRFDDLMRAADILGIETVIEPYINPEDRPTNLEGWQEFAEGLAERASKVTKTGRRFAWHNHDFEFKALPDNQLPIDVILNASSEIHSEMDLAWVRVADRNPAEELEKRKDRVIAVHIKDIAPKGENTDQDGWTNVGQGVMDWEAVSLVLPNTSVQYGALEHDNPKDVVDFINQSVSFANKI